MVDLHLRYMQSADIEQVIAIDNASFSPPWSPTSYEFELHEFEISFMVVLERLAERPASGWRRILDNLRGHPTGNAIVGYGGLWKIKEEAHISTIASHPSYRGMKYGELLLVSMIRRSLVLNAGYIVLEVRVSNQVAQALYQKYGFRVHGVKHEYYHSNNEDALDMRVSLTRNYRQWFNEQYQQLQQTIHFHDDYSHTAHPRIGI